MVVDLDSDLASDTFLTHSSPKIHWASLSYGPDLLNGEQKQIGAGCPWNPRSHVHLVSPSLDVFSYSVGNVPFFGVGWIKLKDIAGTWGQAEVCRFSQVPASLLDSELLFRVEDGFPLTFSSLRHRGRASKCWLALQMSELIFVPVSVTPVSTRTPTQSDLAWPDLTELFQVQNSLHL